MDPTTPYLNEIDLVPEDDAFIPRSRTIGYGVPYNDPNLALHCGTCKAPEGVPCTKRGGGPHTTRIDKVRKKFWRKTHELAMKRENEEYRRNPDAGLWRADAYPHPCGTAGYHVRTDCTPRKENV